MTVIGIQAGEWDTSYHDRLPTHYFDTELEEEVVEGLIKFVHASVSDNKRLQYFKDHDDFTYIGTRLKTFAIQEDLDYLRKIREQTKNDNNPSFMQRYE